MISRAPARGQNSTGTFSLNGEYILAQYQGWVLSRKKLHFHFSVEETGNFRKELEELEISGTGNFKSNFVYYKYSTNLLVLQIKSFDI